jgi:hypothetical protein
LLNNEKHGNTDTIIRFKGNDTNLLEGTDTCTIATEYAMASLKIASTPCVTYLFYGGGHYPTYYRGNQVHKNGYYFVVDYDGLKRCITDSLFCP